MSWETCTGVFVREENDICIVWTKEFNHVYVREENFDMQIQRCRRIQVDVCTVERVHGQYKYEGINCRLLLNAPYARIANTFFGGEFSECLDGKRRKTIQWRGIFKLLRENAVGGGYVQSVRLEEDVGSSPPCFIDRAFIPKQDREQLMFNELTQFEGSVMLYYFADPNVCPWKWISSNYVTEYKSTTHNSVVTSAYQNSTQKILEQKQRKQLNACLAGAQLLRPGSSIFVPAPKVATTPVVERTIRMSLFGYCLFSDAFSNYFYCCDDDDIGHNETFYGSLLKTLKSSYRMQFGEWYRLVLNTYDVVLNPHLLRDDCIVSVEPIDALADEPIFLSSSVNGDDHCALILVKVCVLLSPEFTLFSRSIRRLDDPNGIVFNAVRNCPLIAESGQAELVVEVSVSMINGFVVKRCICPYEGNSLETYAYLARITTDVHIKDNSQFSMANESMENKLPAVQQPIVSSDCANQRSQLATRDQFPVPSRKIPSQQSQPGLKSCSIKETLNHLFSDKFKPIIEDEDMKDALHATLVALNCCVDEVNLNNVASNKHANSSTSLTVRKSQNHHDTLIGNPERPDYPREDSHDWNATSTSSEAVPPGQQPILVSCDVNQECRLELSYAKSDESYDVFPGTSTASAPSMEVAPGQSNTGLKLKSGSVKKILNHLMLDKVKAIIEIEGMKSILDDLVSSMNRVCTNQGEEHASSSSDVEIKKNYDVKSKPGAPNYPQEDVRAENTQSVDCVPMEMKNSLHPDALNNVLNALQSPHLLNIIVEEGLWEELRLITKSIV